MKLLFALIFIFFQLLTIKICQCQNNIGIKYFGLSIHPKGEKENAHLMPYKLDKYGYLVLNFGAEIMYERFFLEDLFNIKIIQAIYADCATRLGGFSHIGLRGKIFKKEKHCLYGGIGPTLIYRKNWLELNGYVNLHRFKGEINDKWQYLFLWYAGEFEYKYFLSNNYDLSISFVPGYPDLMSLSIGLNLKLKGKNITNYFQKSQP
jgi:hypothetical protein